MIFFYIVLIKNWKLYWSEKSLLVLGCRTDAYFEDCNKPSYKDKIEFHKVFPMRNFHVEIAANFGQKVIKDIAFRSMWKSG